MSDDTTNGPAHRAETPTPSKLQETVRGVQEAVKAPRVNNPQLHKEVRTLADTQQHTLDILTEVTGKLETALEDAKAAREKAKEALDKYENSGLPQDPETVRSLLRYVADAQEQEKKLNGFKDDASSIRTDAEGDNRRARRLAESEAGDLSDDVDDSLEKFRKNLRAVDKKIDDVEEKLNQRITDEAERLDKRIDDERKTTDDKFKDIKPSKEDKGLGRKVQEDMAALSQRVDTVQTSVNERPSLAPIGVGVFVGFIVFVIAAIATAFSPSGFAFWPVFVISCGFGFATAGLVAMIMGSRRKKVTAETTTKPSAKQRATKWLNDATKPKDDTATQPVTITKKETVTTR